MKILVACKKHVKTIDKILAMNYNIIDVAPYIGRAGGNCLSGIK